MIVVENQSDVLLEFGLRFDAQRIKSFSLLRISVLRRSVLLNYQIAVIVQIGLEKRFPVVEFILFRYPCFGHLFRHASCFDVVSEEKTNNDENENSHEQVEIADNYFSVAKFEFRIETVELRTFEINVNVSGFRFLVFDGQISKMNFRNFRLRVE